ncbi:peptidyl-prolyl cis-trans isomerase FKBP53-like [Gossypium australe]|uniref:Peptidyl-prolyl cis-trans isomerase FKBP53-like n=1 Tax=Gossypium australe TaxID=47621 RepID=A0A5B6X3U5_9ROSI|nr:peptidyl-prolyl cis-trans isomerase FKBP53-like [Gossypium australe]
MAFWGTEVKPGKPFTHAPLNGRLHLSQVTLGMVCFLIRLSVVNSNLEFEDRFSIIGPRTVHLTGYYLSSSSLNYHNDEPESYGEDIAGTKIERSEISEESEYGGSFIDDEEPQVLSSSQDFSAISEYLKIPKGDKGRLKRRLRKKYRNSGSENEESSSQKDFTSGVATMEVLESETEDKLPISSLSWGKCTSKSGKANVEKKSRKEADNHSDNEIEDNVTMLKGTNAVRGVEPKCKSMNRNGGKQKHEHRVDNALVPKKKREDLAKEEGLLEADHCMFEEVILEQNNQNKKLTSNKKCKYDNLLLASSQVDTEVGVKLKRKKKRTN